MQKIIQVTGFPFVSHVDQEKRPIMDFNLSEPLSDMNILSYGCFKGMGYKFNLRPFLKKFLVKQYGSWQEYYAYNKTNLRKSIYGKIDQIVEIPSTN